MGDGSWFSANRSTVKRSEGRNAVAAAAYYAGMKLYDATERTQHDYTRKRGVVEAFVTTPFDRINVEWAHDIERLSNAMEASEKRKDAQVGHVWRIALPTALTEDERSALTYELAQKLSDLYGVAVIGGIHLPDEKGDTRNHHCHLLFTTRQVEADGKLGAKVTSLTDPKTAKAEVTRYREIVADLINDALEENGSTDERVSHLSYAARGIDNVPTVHLGPSASGLERRGELTDRGDINRDIIAAREAIEARLVWQQTITETSAEIDRELSARFGDDFAAVLKEARAGEPLPDIEEHARHNAPPLHDDIARSGQTEILPQPHGWRERMQALASYALAFFHDEGGAPKQQPEPHPEPELSPSPAPEQPRSWMARVMESRAMQAGRKLLHGWSHRDGAEMLEGAKEAGEVLKARIFPTGDEDSFRDAVRDTVAEGPRHPAAEIARLRAEAGPNEGGNAAPGNLRDHAGEIWCDERGSVPLTDPAPAAQQEGWERFHRSAHAALKPTAPTPEPEAAPKPMTAFDRLAASLKPGDTPGERPPPLTAFDRLAEAYQRALSDQPEPDDSYDDLGPDPEPDPPEPEPWHGPDIDI